MYDGGSNSHPQLRSISGSWSSIVPVVSSSNSLFVWFTSDGSGQTNKELLDDTTGTILLPQLPDIDLS